MRGLPAAILVLNVVLPHVAAAQENIAPSSNLHPALVDGAMAASGEEACVNNSSVGPGWNPGETIVITFPGMARVTGFGIFIGELTFGEVASGTIEREGADGAWGPVRGFTDVGARNGNERIQLTQTVEASSFRLTMAGGGGPDANICVREIEVYGTLLDRAPLLVTLPGQLRYLHDDEPVTVTLSDQLQYLHAEEPVTVTLFGQLRYLHGGEPVTVTLADQLRYLHEDEPVTVTLFGQLQYLHDGEPVTASEFSVDAREHASSGGAGLPTGLIVGATDRLTIRAAANQFWSAGPPLGDCTRTSGAEGIGTACFGQLTSSGLSANYGSLVGRVGDGAYFLIGNSYDGVPGSEGELRLYFWDNYDADNAGEISVTVTISPMNQ